MNYGLLKICFECVYQMSEGYLLMDDQVKTSWIATQKMEVLRTRDMENFIAITLETGRGCGIVANAKLITGQIGHAGEIGHTTVFYDGTLCACSHWDAWRRLFLRRV